MWKKTSEQPFKAGFRKMINRVFILPNGKQCDFDIKNEGPAVCVLPLTKNNNVILTRQFRPGPEKIFLELPGGGLDNGEIPEQAARRELLEETGYKGDFEFVGTCFDCAYSTMKRYCFVAKNCEKIQEQKLDETEFIDVEEKTIEEFREILRSGEMTDVEVGYLALDFLGFLK
jgi:ADP-ribose pyrophosphatase